MRQILLKVPTYNPGDKSEIAKEVALQGLKFNIYKCNNRPKPNHNNIIIFTCFGELGCTSLLPLYCIPRLLQGKYRGKYSIITCWSKQKFLFQHLVDEVWELDAEFNILKETARAFHDDSKNLKKLREKLKEVGHVVPDSELSNICCFPILNECPKSDCKGKITRAESGQQCQKCGITYDPAGLFFDCEAAKNTAIRLPDPHPRHPVDIPPNSVGLVARGRKCYGRNLKPEFYERLGWLLEDFGYNVVWLEEKGSSQSCPCERFIQPNPSDLEETFAVVKKLKFTIQFWTASSRLAGMMSVPFIIVESPDQIWSSGHEGYRLHLTSFAPKKLILAHFRNVLENNTKALRVMETAIREIQSGDYSTMISPVVEDEIAVRELRRKNKYIKWF